MFTGCVKTDQEHITNQHYVAHHQQKMDFAFFDDATGLNEIINSFLLMVMFGKNDQNIIIELVTVLSMIKKAKGLKPQEQWG